MREIYLDNCATTRPRSQVVEDMVEVLRDDYGNPSSLHRRGFEIEKKIEKSREEVADFLGVEKDEIYFTSGGTESNNIAIQSILDKAREKRHIITTTIEHSSITNIMKHYEDKGFEVSYLDVDQEGLISLEDLESSLREDTLLVSLILVNNEIGSIQDIDRISKIVKNKNKDIYLHLDAIQAVGKIDLDIKKWRLDSLSISGHKLHGPKGIGALYVKKDLKLDPIVYGGNQERGLRSGTENVPGIIGLGRAMAIQAGEFEKDRKHVESLKKYLIERIPKKIEGVKFNGPLDERASPYILNLSFSNIRAEILLHYLENHNIYISTGSACSKGSIKSRTLEAIGLNDSEIDGAIRICFSYNTRMEDLDFFIDKVRDGVDEIREITMR